MNLLDYIIKLICSIILDKDIKNVNMNVLNEFWSVKWLLGNNFFYVYLRSFYGNNGN